MAHLNPEDFTKLQNQLLELREKNYGLEDTLRKCKKELTETKSRLHSLEEENGRYQILVRTSKKASEVELLIRDNGYLRNKLKDQEEDFRLQNNTLLRELSKLVGENEQYERQMKVLCSSQSCGLAEGDYGSTDDSKEVIRLRGELKDMHKKLFEAEGLLEKENKAHSEKVSALNLQISQLTNVLQTHSIPLDEGEINLGKGGGVSFRKLTLQDDDGLETDLERTNDTHLQSQDKCSQLQCEIEKLQTQLRGEKEITDSLTSEKTKLEESLTSANERLNNAEAEERNKIDAKHLEEAERRMKDMEAQHRTHVEELKQSLGDVESKLTECRSNLAEKCAQYEAALDSVQQLEHKLQSAEEGVLEARNATLHKAKECQALQDKVNAATKDIAQMLDQKQTVEKENKEFEIKISNQHQEIAALNTSLQEQTKLAESRHGLMEEMKAHIEEEKQKQQQKLDELQNVHKEEMDSLSSQNQHLKEIDGKIMELSDLNTKLMQLQQEKITLMEFNEKLKGDVEVAQKKAQEDLDRVTAEKCQDIENLKWEYKKEKSDLHTQLEISTIQRQEAEDTVEALKRKVADGEEEQRIHERKGVTLLKDLKKQLMAERKRADRLQEKLSQLLTDPAQLTAITTVSEAGDDVSSVSSWSMVSGEPRDSSTRENSIIASPQGSPPPGIVTEETVSLVNRVTELQQHKWQLEERITHLESSSAAMADDLLKKSAIIQHFCMDHKNIEHTGSPPTSPVHPTPLGDKLNVRRVLEMVRGGTSEESLREINRRLQSLLEETLGKNMQLHKDVENLSQQVHQLSKLAAVKTETELPVAVNVYEETQACNEERGDTDISKS
ncbi:GRIP1-associated protein 1-like isoform X2 [Portunus trituberculatus]|uniref:GRIP1-associated protein 1-like isoform X2 n=1 Tax=Portunus trituberculatus TaxID=210409 RepID=UPI001E1CEEDB|nr:GRIP1-associated protein 1-like isoform X2 [Portunus trituberculatus]